MNLLDGQASRVRTRSPESHAPGPRARQHGTHSVDSDTTRVGWRVPRTGAIPPADVIGAIMVAIPPPSKKEQLNKLLERGSVFVHLDPRREGVVVPAWLTKKPQLVLQLGLNFPIPIRDLEIDEVAVRC